MIDLDAIERRLNESACGPNEACCCSDIPGLLAEIRMLRGPSHVAYASREDLHGKGFRKKDGTFIPIAFSPTLIKMAGGLDRLLAEWEEDPRW